MVITGVGLLSPLGPGLEVALAALQAGAEPLVETTELDGGRRRVGRVPSFDPRPYFRSPKTLKLTDRKTQLAVAAAVQALGAADLAAEPADGQAAAEPGDNDWAVLMGCSAMDLQIEQLAAALAPDPEARSASDVPFFAERVGKRLYPLWLLVNLPNMLSAQVAIQLGSSGPNHTLMTEWIAGLQAIGEAAQLIREGVVQVALAGGAECPLTPYYAACLGQDGAARDLPLAEAAAVFVLEAEAHALRRGAAILGEVIGFATRGPRGAERAAPAALDAVRRQLEAAAERPPDGSTQRRFPRLELADDGPGNGGEGLAALAGLGAIPVRSPASGLTHRLGHSLAASGAVQLALALAAARKERDAGVIVSTCRGRSGASACLAVEIGR